MPEAPRISGDEAIKVFMILGFHQARQKGSYVIMRQGDKGCVIPRHKEPALGTLRNAIRQAASVWMSSLRPTKNSEKTRPPFFEEANQPLHRTSLWRSVPD